MFRFVCWAILHLEHFVVWMLWVVLFECMRHHGLLESLWGEFEIWKILDEGAVHSKAKQKSSLFFLWICSRHSSLCELHQQRLIYPVHWSVFFSDFFQRNHVQMFTFCCLHVISHNFDFFSPEFNFSKKSRTKLFLSFTRDFPQFWVFYLKITNLWENTYKMKGSGF